MIFSFNNKSDLTDNIDRIKEKESAIKIDSNNSILYNNNHLWLKKTFKKYYFSYFTKIALPEKINLREFGFRHFDEKMYRHLSFSNAGELYAFVLKYSPSDIFCSSSFYRNPSEPMDKKDWYGSELIFDIDGKDLHLDCTLTHNYTRCYACNFINTGVFEKCSNCNGSRLSVIDIPCKNCIFFLKKEVKKLIKLLTEDFGIDNKTISVYFSGNNGFHLHITDKDYYPLLSNERAEISSYLLGKGFKLETLGIKLNNEKKYIPLQKNKQLLDVGWRQRILKNLKINFHSNKNTDNDFIKQIEKLEISLNSNFQQIVSKAIENLSVKIDPVVTMDIHRIFRLAGSINSKSGLVKILCNDIDSFDPFKDACFFDSSKVEIISKIDFSIVFRGKRYNLNKGLINVPEYLAVYLISKGLADINIKEI
jgi:DNA primase small subunit